MQIRTHFAAGNPEGPAPTIKTRLDIVLDESEQKHALRSGNK